MSNGIESIIAHLTAANLDAGQSMASIHEAIQNMKSAHEQLSRAIEHVSGARGTGTSATLDAIIALYSDIQGTLNQHVGALPMTHVLMEKAQEKAQEYIMHLEG